MKTTIKSKGCFVSLLFLTLLVAACGGKPEGNSGKPGGDTGTPNSTVTNSSNTNNKPATIKPGEITHTDPATGTVTRKACQEASDCGIQNAVCSNGKCFEESDKCQKVTCGALERCEKGTGALADKVYCVPNCNQSEQCGGVCRSATDAGKECVDFKWTDPCPGGVNHCMTSGGPFCCEDGKGCVGNTCVPVSTSCDPDAEIYCKITEYCDDGIKKCVKYDDAKDLCIFRPPNIKDTKVTLHWQASGSTIPLYDFKAVYTTPLVVDLDGDKVPEIIFLKFGVGRQYDSQLVVIKSTPGTKVDDVTEVWAADAGFGNNGGFIYSDIAPAVGDLDGDGTPEIVVLVNSKRSDGSFRVQSAIKAFKADGTQLFQKDLPSDTYHAEAGGISIGDIDGDGTPEIVTLGQVFDNKGDRIAKLPFDTSQLPDTTRWIPYNDKRNLKSDVPVLADVNLDGHLDIVDGRMVFLYKSGSGSSIQFEQSVRDDGQKSTRPYGGHGAVSAIANFKTNVSTYPQIITAHDDMVYLTDWKGNDLAKAKAPFVTLKQWAGEGAPTIADFDGDGVPEVGITYNGGFAVYDVDYDESNGTFTIALQWYFRSAHPTEEITGSSVFDFDGDGVAEVVYVDDSYIYVLDGTKGRHWTDKYRLSDDGVIVKIPNANKAVWGASLEPVVADVDNDGHADIVASSSDGVRVFSNPKNYWVPTRPIWNQHAYFVTNVTTDGKIPTVQKKNWQQPWLNNFRQNVQEGNPFLAADFVIKAKPPFDKGCALNASQLNLEYQIQNIGSAPARPNSVKVKVFTVKNGSETLVFEHMNKNAIPPLGSETFKDTLDVSGQLPLDLKYVVDADNSYNECREDNNETTIEKIGENAADATVTISASDVGSCVTTHKLPITVTVKNEGTSEIPANSVDVKLYGRIGEGGKKELLKTFKLDQAVAGGGTLELQYTWDGLKDDSLNKLIYLDAVIDEENKLEECDETNNEASTTTICQLYG